MNDMAKLFWTGRSQAVRLPKAFRFEGSRVRISRRDDGAVVLESTEEDDDVWANRIAGSFDNDFARAVLEGRLGPQDMPEGPSFD